MEATLIRYHNSGYLELILKLSDGNSVHQPMFGIAADTINHFYDLQVLEKFETYDIVKPQLKPAGQEKEEEQ